LLSIFLSQKLIYSFIFKGFLCPICRRKFVDTTGLEHHYLQAHSQSESATNHQDINGNRNSIKYEETEVKKHMKYKKILLKIYFRILFKKQVFGNNNFLYQKKVECNVKIFFLIFLIINFVL
jgi:hypothetical protein